MEIRLSKKSYLKERSKYEAKRAFNPRAKRFWLAVASPFAFMLAQPALDTDTIKDYKEDVGQIDQTMTDNMDESMIGYIQAKQELEALNRAVYADKYDGTVSPDLLREQRVANMNIWAQERRLKEYLLLDPRMTEQQFGQYNNFLQRMDAPVLQQPVNSYALKECQVTYHMRQRQTEQCLTMEEDRPLEEFLAFGWVGFIGSGFANLILSVLTPYKPVQKPKPSDFKPRRPRPRQD